VWLQHLFRPADFYENFAGGPGPFDKPEKAHELSVPMAFVNSLCFDNRQRKVACIAQEKINAFGRLPYETFTDGNDAAIRNGPLFGDRMRFVIPACRLQLGNDVFAASVGFGEHLGQLRDRFP